MKDIEIFIDAHVLGGLSPAQVTYGWSAKWSYDNDASRYCQDYRGGYGTEEEAIQSAVKTLTYIAEQRRIADHLTRLYPKTITAKDLTEL